MKIDFGEHNTIVNLQVGNDNYMDIKGEGDFNNIIIDEEWKQLQFLLDKCLAEGTNNSFQFKILFNANEYVKRKDKRGLRDFINKNKDDFWTSVASSTVAAGLVEILKKIFGHI